MAAGGWGTGKVAAGRGPGDGGAGTVVMATAHGFAVSVGGLFQLVGAVAAMGAAGGLRFLGLAALFRNARLPR